MHKRLVLTFWMVVLAIGSSLFTGIARGGSVEASLDRTTVPMGETVTLTLTVKGSPNVTPQLPAIPGLRQLSTSTSQSISIENGKIGRTLILTTELAPESTGDIVIPSVSGMVDGARVATKPIKLTVTAAGTAPKTEAGRLPSGEPIPAFLRLIVPKKEVYVGEAIPLAIELYCQSNVQDLHFPQLESDGFIFGPLAKQAQTQSRANGMVYALLPFRLSATAAKTGTLTLGPATAELTALYGPRNFWGQYTKGQPVKLESDPVPLTVLPIPKEGVPASFNGAVGSFSLSVTTSPTNIAVGDPITVKCRIQGKGSLDALIFPEQRTWTGFKSYPATKKIESDDPLTLEGTAVFEQAVVPESPELTVLPPFEFSFFDPEKKSFVTLTNPATSISVSPTRTSVSPVLADGQSSTPNAQNEMAPIKVRLGNARVRTDRGQYMSAIFGSLAFASSPLLLAAFVGLFAWQRNVRLRNPAAIRRREIEQKSKDAIEALDEIVARNDVAQFHALMFRTLQEVLGWKLDLPPQAITAEAVARLSDELPPETLEDLRGLFQACDQARFGLEHDPLALKSMQIKLENILDALLHAA